MWSPACGRFSIKQIIANIPPAIPRAAIAALFLCPLTAPALGPHECVVIVNRNSMESLELANYYADLRNIPPQNIIHLGLPDSFREAASTITPDDFNKYIFEPVTKIIAERRLQGHILAWLYSLDFPSTVQTDPPMSLTGMTFVRGKTPANSDIKSGTWLSPLFRGPDHPEGPSSPSVSLEQFTIPLATNMPIPSMMLGWSGSRGMTLAQIKQQLRRSAASDGTQPSDRLFFEVNNNVRSTTRSWQFEPAIKELGALHINARAGSDLPKRGEAHMGILAGRSDLHAADFGSLAPGAYADHLTSFGALFHTPEQTKITAWLRHGAAGTAGTIVEPGSLEYPVMLWAKFPATRLFTHYAQGCTLIESLYLSTRSPLQTLMVGDALCAPWSRPAAVTTVNLSGLPDEPVSGDVEFMTQVTDISTNAQHVMMYLMDGRPMQPKGNSEQHIYFSTKALTDGYHELRALAYKNGPVRHQSFDIHGFRINNRARHISISGFSPGQSVDLYHPLRFRFVTGDEKPDEVALVVQERVIARTNFAADVDINIMPLLLGAGPVSFQAVAVYAGKESVRSEPMRLNIEALNEPPEITGIDITTNTNNDLQLHFAVSDQDDHQPAHLWLANALAWNSSPAFFPDENIAVTEPDGHELSLVARSKWATATWELDAPNHVKEIHATFQWQTDQSIHQAHQAGVVFNYTDEHNFFYWGADGYLGAWTLKQMRDGNEVNIITRGDPIELNKEYTLMAIAITPQKMAFIVNNNVEAVADVSFSPGRVGVRAGTEPVLFKQMLIAPASAARAYLTEHDKTLRVPAGQHDAIDFIEAGARDVQFTVTRPVRAQD